MTQYNYHTYYTAMKKYYQINKKNLEGIDVNLEISLKGYGIAWRILPSKNIVRFFVGYTLVQTECGGYDFTEFEMVEYPLDLDVRDEYDWVNFDDVYSFVGMSGDEWDKLTLPQKMCDLKSYYGADIFW